MNSKTGEFENLGNPHIKFHKTYTFTYDLSKPPPNIESLTPRKRKKKKEKFSIRFQKFIRWYVL